MHLHMVGPSKCYNAIKNVKNSWDERYAKVYHLKHVTGSSKNLQVCIDHVPFVYISANKTYARRGVVTVCFPKDRQIQVANHSLSNMNNHKATKVLSTAIATFLA